MVVYVRWDLQLWKKADPVTLKAKYNIKKAPVEYIPPKDVRRDQYDHWPVIEENKMRCKYVGCKEFIHTKCRKCWVALWLNKNNNCFYDILHWKLKRSFLTFPTQCWLSATYPFLPGQWTLETIWNFLNIYISRFPGNISIHQLFRKLKSKFQKNLKNHVFEG